MWKSILKDDLPDYLKKPDLGFMGRSPDRAEPDMDDVVRRYNELSEMALEIRDMVRTIRSSGFERDMRGGNRYKYAEAFAKEIEDALGQLEQLDIETHGGN